MKKFLMFLVVTAFIFVHVGNISACTDLLVKPFDITQLRASINGEIGYEFENTIPIEEIDEAYVTHITDLNATSLTVSPYYYPSRCTPYMIPAYIVSVGISTGIDGLHLESAPPDPGCFSGSLFANEMVNIDSTGEWTGELYGTHLTHGTKFIVAGVPATITATVISSELYHEPVDTAKFLLTAHTFNLHAIDMHLSHGDGAFNPPVFIDAFFEGYEEPEVIYGEFVIADFTGDGALDFIASKNENPATLYLFTRVAPTPTSFQKTYLTTLDFDPKAAYYLDPLGGNNPLLAPDYGLGLIAADLDNDGDMDFLENINHDFGSHTYWIAKGNAYLNNGDGKFTRIANAFDFSSISTGWTLGMSSTMVDVNGDNYPDMLASEQSSGDTVSSGVYLLKGKGDGSFQSPVLVFTTKGNPATYMTLGDFNNDGKVDAIVGQDDDGDPGAAFLFLGNGDGTFAQTGIEAYDTRPDIESGSDQPGHGKFQAYDVDGDGILDIISAAALFGPVADNPGDTELFFFHGQGDGRFDAPQIITSNMLTPNAFIAPGPSCCTDDVDVNLDPAKITEIPGIDPYTMTGAEMDGMVVIAEFSDGFAEAQLWEDIDPYSGGVFGSGWSLTESGDTFGGLWTLTRDDTYQNRELTRIWIDALTGGTVFDTSFGIGFGGEFGTEGSALGWTFDVQSAPCNLKIEVTYSDMVSLNAQEPVGDIFRYLKISFTNPGGFAAGDTLTFIADTDKVVPEPSTLLLLGAGLIGVFALRRKGFRR